MTTPAFPAGTRPPDRSRFGQRLTAISTRGRAAHEQDRARRRAARLQRSQELLGAYAFLGKVEQLAMTLLEDLTSELPVSTKLLRATFDGRYQVVMRLEEELRDAAGRKFHAFSRLAFLLDPQASENRFEVECRATVRNRDIDGARLVVPMDQGSENLRAFLETRALVFAQHYFEADRVTLLGDAAPDATRLEQSLSL